MATHPVLCSLSASGVNNLCASATCSVAMFQIRANIRIFEGLGEEDKDFFFCEIRLCAKMPESTGT